MKLFRGLLALLLAMAPEAAFAAYPGQAPLIVANGGTGATTLTAHGMLVGEGTGPIVSITPVADSVWVQGSASSDPTTAGTSSTADSALGWGAAGSTPSPVSFGSTCLNALTYTTSTHSFSCANPTNHAIVVGGASGAAFSVLANVADSVVVFGAAATDPTTAGTSSTADSVLGWGAAGSTPAPLGLSSCSTGTSALTYNTGTHAFGCNSISTGTGVALSTAAVTSTATINIAATNGLTSIINTGTAATTINLPTGTQTNGFRLCVKDGTEGFTTNPATVKATAGTIDGTSGSTGIPNFFNMNKQETCFISDGTNWLVE